MVRGNGVVAWLLAAIVGLALSACAARTSEPARVETGKPPDFPERVYRQAAAEGRPVFRIDAARSIVVVEVRRGGPLARLGHDHVVASHDVHGYVLADGGRADLYVPLERLAVDEPQLRAEAGFDTKPSAGDIAGTQRNMRERVLDVAQYPFALVSVRGVGAATGAREADVAITLHGATRSLRVPLQIDASVTGVDVAGALQIDQTDFGIVPMSILGGAVTVENALRLRFRIHSEVLFAG